MMNITDKIYHDEEASRLHLEKMRWDWKVTCPHCGGVDKCKPTKIMSKPSKANPEPVEVKGYYLCGDCRKRFTVRTGTVYERSHIPLHKWILATHLLCASKKGMSAHQLHRMIGVTYKSAWFMAHRIREAMHDTDPTPMGGEGVSVQADETYFGKKDNPPKMRTSGEPFKKSGKAAAKMSVASLISEGKSRTFHVDRADVETVRDILKKNVHATTSLYTDESRLDARPLAKLFRQIAPWRAGPGNPENPIKNTAVVGGFPSVRGAGCQDEPLKERPFLVRHQVSCHAGLHRRYQLESCSKPDVNPFCQHDLNPKQIALLA